LGNLDSTSETVKEPIILNSWAVVLEDGTYCRIEENNLMDTHFKAVVHVEAKENGCQFCPYVKGGNVPVLTSSIWNVRDGDIFVTQHGTEYRLGEPHPLYKKLFGGLGQGDLVNKLVNVIRKKRLL
jgi:hypothetical protein